MTTTVRPLEDIPCADAAELGWSADLLTVLPSTEGYRAAFDYFTGYPVESLSSSASRAFMYNLIRARRPELFVEIGTYRCGMTEVVARAMQSNGGNGQVVTIDPYGRERVPDLLTGWPKQLSERVVYLPLSSMDFFIEMRKLRPSVDLCFVDGDHAYEFAFFDLNSIAQWIRPGGIVIMDDYSQPGVFWATKHFLALNPGWREIGGAFEDFAASPSFDSIRPSIPDTGFLVLAAPDSITVGEKPCVIEDTDFAALELSGLGFDLLPEHDGGTLEARVYLRSFRHDERQGHPEQLELTCSTAVAPGASQATLAFDPPLRSSLDPATSRRMLELNLTWTPQGTGRVLQLVSQPHPLPVD